MTLRRTHTGPKLMEALQMLKFNYRCGQTLDFTIGMHKDEKITLLEELTNEQTHVPEDLMSFLSSLNSDN